MQSRTRPKESVVAKYLRVKIINENFGKQKTTANWQRFLYLKFRSILNSTHHKQPEGLQQLLQQDFLRYGVFPACEPILRL